MIIGIIDQKADVVCFALIVFMMNSIFILYEIRDYQNRKNSIGMYITNRQILAAWAKTTIEGLKREAALALRVEELERKKKSGTSKKAKASK